MVSLVEIDSENVGDYLALRVLGEQAGFVAPNDVSMHEAQLTVAAGGHAFPFGIAADDMPVGFLMVGYDVDECWGDAPAIARGTYSLWRLMIDGAHQRKGYGRQAALLALDFIRTWPAGRADLCWLSFEPTNHVARHLYRSLGFRETGERDGDELIASLRL